MTLDGYAKQTSGFAAQDVFNVSLFAAEGLALGPHTVVLANVNRTWLDLDYAVFTTGDGSSRCACPRRARAMTDADAGGRCHRTVDAGETIDDSDPVIQWSEEWGTTDGAQYGYNKTQQCVVFSPLLSCVRWR